jgi:hypothetical protein
MLFLGVNESLMVDSTYQVGKQYTVMNLKSQITGLMLLIFLCLSMAACSSKEKRAIDVTSKLNEQEFRQRLELINPGLKDPASVIELIENSGAEFLENLVNTGGHDSIYLLDSALSALNLGIYTVDIAYLVTYNKNEEMLVQLEKARVMAETLGAGHLYDHAMFRRYQTMGVPKDSLMMILRHAAEQVEHDFSRTELMRIYTLFATGEFIEKLHLTTQLLIHADRENDDSYLNLMLLLFHQENSLRKLVNLLDQVRRREEGERFMAMLSDLQLIFMEMNTPDELAGINTSNITDNQIFKDLVAQVDRIRDQIMDPEYP